MIDIKRILALTLITFTLSAFGQIERGSLLNNEIPSCVDSFFINNKINLSELRKITNFLTNRDVRQYSGVVIPRRKTAFIRHVKHLSEALECHYYDSNVIDSETVERIYELHLLSSSLQQKAKQNSIVKIPFSEKFEMATATRKSTKIFQYKILDNKEYDLDSVLSDPKDSPYYHAVNSEMPMHKQFAYLAKQKKIKHKKDMIVLFQSVSDGGSAPKISTLDLDLDNKWSLKWGDEVHTDILGSRIFAGLGYDVDHPYYYGKNQLVLVFDYECEVNSPDELIRSLKQVYKVDITPFISSEGMVSNEMISKNKKLEPFKGKPYLTFLKCSVEARPDRVKRLGSFLPFDSINSNRKELKGSLLLHHFIGNWDTREANTLLTTVHSGNYNYRISAVFSDLGTSFGVVQNRFPPDFKVGLVNEFPWEVMTKKNNKIRFNNRINGLLPFYMNAHYTDLLWMAHKIAGIDEYNLKKMIKKAHWPEPIAELFFHKMASRRASILSAFDIKDPNPILFDKEIDIIHKGEEVVKCGKLIVDFKPVKHPEGFISKKGRLRNYGH